MLARKGDSLAARRPERGHDLRTPSVGAADQVSLCEALDRVLTKGAVVLGDVTISVADIDLIYLGLQVVLASIETARGLPMMTTLAGARANGDIKEMADGAC